MKERNKQSAPAKKELFNYLENYTKVGHSPQRVPTNTYHRYNDHHQNNIMTQSDGEDGEDDPQSAMLNEYYATLTAQQQKLL